MKISYNWLKWYVPEVPEAKKLADILTYHLAEVETVEEKGDDFILDIKILPNRAHDLLSHMGIAKEVSSLLRIKYNDPEPQYKKPETKPATLKIEVESEKCRRYMGRIIRNVKVGPSPEWVIKHLESIGQRSINNMVDAANLVMFNCGQPTHVFDLNKVKDKIVVRDAKEGETLITLDNKDCKFKSSDLVIADNEKVLGVAGVKGGKSTEVDSNTTDIILEVANFEPTSVRKTAALLNIFTDAKKRFENDLSPELGPYAMRELSSLILEMCPEASFEDIVDMYPKKQEEKRVQFSLARVSNILGIDVSASEVKNILNRCNISYTENGDIFEVVSPTMRLDLNIEEDMAEEVGRILGYDKVKGRMPKIEFAPKKNETYEKILWARHKLLGDGYSEVMTSSFRDKGEVNVLASASDKNFLRNNLTDGIKESIKLNQLNAPFLGQKEAKIFEIGTVFRKGGEEMMVAYGNKKEIKEVSLKDFCKEMTTGTSPKSREIAGTFSMWSLYPFIARDVAVWVPEGVASDEVLEVIKSELSSNVVRGPELFDEFKKEGKTSYAFRIVFQSFDKTLTDEEVNSVMENITNKIKANPDWQVR